MYKSYEGLPAAANVEQSIMLAQLQILRHMEATRAGLVRSVLPQLGAAPEIVASWSPAQE
jgi:hypothetical protein